MDKALSGCRGSPRLWKDAVAEAAKELGLKPCKIDNSLHLDPVKFLQHAHIDDPHLSGNNRLVRGHGAKVATKVHCEES